MPGAWRGGHAQLVNPGGLGKIGLDQGRGGSPKPQARPRSLAPWGFHCGLLS